MCISVRDNFGVFLTNLRGLFAARRLALTLRGLRLVINAASIPRVPEPPQSCVRRQWSVEGGPEGRHGFLCLDPAFTRKFANFRSTTLSWGRGGGGVGVAVVFHSSFLLSPPCRCSFHYNNIHLLIPVALVYRAAPTWRFCPREVVVSGWGI